MSSDNTDRAPVSAEFPVPGGSRGARALAAAQQAAAQTRKEERRKKLPPDPELMNDERAEWAESVLDLYQRITRCDREPALRDLLCGMMHWCDRNNENFDESLAWAEDYYYEDTLPFEQMCDNKDPAVVSAESPVPENSRAALALAADMQAIAQMLDEKRTEL